MLRKLSYFKTVLYKLLLRLWVAIRYQDKKQRKQKLKEWTTKAEKNTSNDIYTPLTQPSPGTRPKQPLSKKFGFAGFRAKKTLPTLSKAAFKAFAGKCPIMKSS